MSPALLPSGADIQAWRRLVAAARAAADRKPRSPDEFLRARGFAYKARFPDQTPATIAVCRQLLTTAEEWPRLDFAHRRMMAEAVRDQAAAVEATLSAGQGPPPPLRAYRADIDG